MNPKLRYLPALPEPFRAWQRRAERMDGAKPWLGKKGLLQGFGIMGTKWLSSIQSRPRLKIGRMQIRTGPCSLHFSHTGLRLNPRDNRASKDYQVCRSRAKSEVQEPMHDQVLKGIQRFTQARDSSSYFCRRSSRACFFLATPSCSRFEAFQSQDFSHNSRNEEA